MRKSSFAIARKCLPAIGCFVMGCNFKIANCSEDTLDICVIGGGVVGLAVARECAVKHKARVLLIEKEDTVSAGYYCNINIELF